MFIISANRAVYCNAEPTYKQLQCSYQLVSVYERIYTYVTLALYLKCLVRLRAKDIFKTADMFMHIRSLVRVGTPQRNITKEYIHPFALHNILVYRGFPLPSTLWRPNYSDSAQMPITPNKIIITPHDAEVSVVNITDNWPKNPDCLVSACVILLSVSYVMKRRRTSGKVRR